MTMTKRWVENCDIRAILHYLDVFLVEQFCLIRSTAAAGGWCLLLVREGSNEREVVTSILPYYNSNTTHKIRTHENNKQEIVTSIHSSYDNARYCAIYLHFVLKLSVHGIEDAEESKVCKTEGGCV